MDSQRITRCQRLGERLTGFQVCRDIGLVDLENQRLNLTDKRGDLLSQPSGVFVWLFTFLNPTAAVEAILQLGQPLLDITARDERFSQLHIVTYRIEERANPRTTLPQLCEGITDELFLAMGADGSEHQRLGRWEALQQAENLVSGYAIDGGL